MDALKRVLMIVVSCSSLGNGQMVPGSPVAIGGPWYEFSISKEGVAAIGCGPSFCQPSSSENSVFADAPPWTLTAPGQGVILTITDAFARVEWFSVYDFGTPIGSTPMPSGGGFCNGDIAQSSDPAGCLTDPLTSHAVFRLAAGAHSITIVPKGVIGTTAAYFRVDLAGTDGAQPSIGVDGVLNASSYAPGIAPGSWFVVFGAGLGPANILSYPGQLPYPTELSGTKVTLTPAAGGAAIEARIWYTHATQLAALLPSSTPAGDYDVRVIHNNVASAPRHVKVVDRNFGFATAAQNGAGPAQATNASLNVGISLIRFTTGSVGFNGLTWQYRPAYPGESLVLWGTGLGADAQSDLNGGTSGDQTRAGSIRVIVGDIEITPAYAGRSAGSPGLDQINFTLPANVELGCAVNLRVLVGGRWSNLGSLAIAPPESVACQHPLLTQTQLKTLDEGGTVIIGRFSVSRREASVSLPGMTVDRTTEAVGGDFFEYRADLLQFDAGGRFTASGTCDVTRLRGNLDEIGLGSSVIAADAGPQFVLNGPGTSNRVVPNAGQNVYSLTLYDSGLMPSPPTGNPTLAGGAYTLSGAGGPEIGAFSVQTPFPAAFDWTNKASITSITRNQPLLVQWIGGGAELGAVVNVSGSSGSRVGGTVNDPIYEVGSFVCTAPAAAGRLTVPADVTNALVPSSGDITTGDIGWLGVSANNGPNIGQFTAPIVAGGSVPGQLTYSWSITKTVPVR